MTILEMLDLEPKVMLADIIQLFLLGYDDKIYINIYGRDEYFIMNARIISADLQPYLDKQIMYLEEPSFDEGSVLNIHLDMEVNNGNQT